jgi:hypothetical protein
MLILPIGLLLASCTNNLGRGVPECDDPGASLILSIQSVPETAFAPCIEHLETGWEYRDLEAQTGQSIFSLDSDRLGGGGPGFEENPFLEVSLLPSCDVSEAIEVESDEPGVPLFVDVEVVIDVPITIVPDSRSLPTVIYADRLQGQLDGAVISGRTVVVTIDRTFRDTSQRISAAQISGHAVVVVSARDAEDRTLTLLLPGSDTELVGLDLSTTPPNLDIDLVPSDEAGAALGESGDFLSRTGDQSDLSAAGQQLPGQYPAYVAGRCRDGNFHGIPLPSTLDSNES